MLENISIAWTSYFCVHYVTFMSSVRDRLAVRETTSVLSELGTTLESGIQLCVYKKSCVSQAAATWVLCLCLHSGAQVYKHTCVWQQLDPDNHWTITKLKILRVIDAWAQV